MSLSLSIGLSLTSHLGAGGSAAPVENLLSNTSDFSSPWVPARATLTENAAIDPEGGATADTLTETAVPGSHNLLRVNAVQLVLGETYNFSIHVAPDGRDWIRMQTRGEDSAFNVLSYANAATGAFGATDHPATLVETAANGFYRFGVDFYAGDTDNTATIYGIYLAEDGSTSSYAGDGLSGVHIWGAQLTLGAGMKIYTPA